MKFSGPAAPGWAPVACALSAGAGPAAFSRDGPLSFSLCRYSVRTMKNCPVELTISFRTFRAAEGAALKVTSTMLRSINVGTGVPPGFAAATLRPGDGDGVGVGTAPRSSGKRGRRRDVTLSTRSEEHTSELQSR